MSGILLGRYGQLASEGIEQAIRAGASGNAALLYGRIVSGNGSAFWVFRQTLADFYGRSTRTITRYFAELVKLGLIVNKPMPKGSIPPGMKAIPHWRVWAKYALFIPLLREKLAITTENARERWQSKYDRNVAEAQTTVKRADLLGMVMGRAKYGVMRTPSAPVVDTPVRTREETLAILARMDREEADRLAAEELKAAIVERAAGQKPTETTTGDSSADFDTS